jgi:hypothetical protein
VNKKKLNNFYFYLTRDKLHGLEYPPGERLIVKFLNDAQMMPNQNSEALFNVGIGNGNSGSGSGGNGKFHI